MLEAHNLQSKDYAHSRAPKQERMPDRAGGLLVERSLSNVAPTSNVTLLSRHRCVLGWSIPMAPSAAIASTLRAACHADQQQGSQAWPVASVPNGSSFSWACSLPPHYTSGPVFLVKVFRVHVPVNNGHILHGGRTFSIAVLDLFGALETPSIFFV